MKKTVNEEKIKRILYSAVALTLCIVALFSFWMANKDNNGVLPEETDVFSQTETQTQKEVQVNTPVTNIPDDRTETTTETHTPLTIEFAFPLKNSISKEFSHDELVKNKTTSDWRIHKGIDIKGASGDRINSIADGTVTELVNSPLWGTIVTVDHENGFIAKYYGLRKDSTVQPGDELKTNDKIGLLDEIPIEKEDGFHLHLEIYKNGVVVSPSSYLGKSVDISE